MASLKLTGLKQEEINKILGLLCIIDLDTGKIADFNKSPVNIAMTGLGRPETLSIHFDENKEDYIIRF